MGSRRRAAAIASPSLVCAFSRTSSWSSWACQVARSVTIGCAAVPSPPSATRSSAMKASCCSYRLSPRTQTPRRRETHRIRAGGSGGRGSGGRGELPGGGVPAPGGGRGEVGAAEPAVDAQQGDAVGLPGEHLVAGRGEAERLAGERRAVAQRRRGAELLAVLRLYQPGWAAAETGHGPEEPGVAQERRVLQVLGG